MIHKKIEIKARGMEAVGNLYTYFLDSSIEMRPDEKRPVILMCPGGGYEMTSDREAEPMAMQFLFCVTVFARYVIRQRCCRWQRVYCI